MNPEKTANDANASEQLLSGFAHTFGASAGAVLSSTGWVTYIVGPELRIKHFLACNTDASEQDDYETHFSVLDPLSPMSCLVQNRWVASLRQMLAQPAAEHAEYQSGFMKRHGIVDALEIFLKSDADLIMGCSLLRHGDAPAFSPQDLAKAEALKSLGDFALSRTFPRRRASVEIIAQRFPALTAREATLVQLVAAGLSNKQLCRELNISLPTVKTHLLNVFRKMDIDNRTELAAKVLG